MLDIVVMSSKYMQPTQFTHCFIVPILRQRYGHLNHKRSNAFYHSKGWNDRLSVYLGHQRLMPLKYQWEGL